MVLFFFLSSSSNCRRIAKKEYVMLHRRILESSYEAQRKNFSFLGF